MRLVQRESSPLWIRQPTFYQPLSMRVARFRHLLPAFALYFCRTETLAFVDSSFFRDHHRLVRPCPAHSVASLVDCKPSTFKKEISLILPFEEASHRSATIVVPENEDSIFARETFKDRLVGTVLALKCINKTSLWVEVPMSRSSLIEEMVDIGFEFHHAQGKSAKLNLWLSEDTESKVPEYATHHVGVGAVVVNSRDEILCVRELRQNFMPWKVPGGLADLGEYIPEAAQREVMEETGIPTKFKSILSFRHTHGLAHGRSDLYFICQLDPIEEVDGAGNIIIPEPIAQECEIEAAEWVPLSEYRAIVNGDGDNPGHPMMKQVISIFDEGKVVKQKTVHSIVPGRKPNPMYYPATAAK
eukprot:scaffold1900_cov123-Cylindrotheca_fusiformis.AAC.26